jgi:hypothetical protein
MAKITGTAGNDILEGTDDNDVLEGLGGSDLLIGGLGADTMFGGLGNDVYSVDDTGDQVVENSDEGTDEIRTSLSAYSLAALPHVENLTGIGTADHILTGNSANNVIDGGVGADTMRGAAGNDTYIVDNVADQVIENADEGVDEVRTTLASYTLGDNLERLFGLSATGQELRGNALGNSITGNVGADTIFGGPGDDLLTGGRGSDFLDGGFGNDTLFGGDGDDTLIGRDGIDTALFSGNRSDYLLVNVGGGQVRVKGVDGTDTLAAIERLQFSNGTFVVPAGIFEQAVGAESNNFGAGPGAGGWSSYDEFPRDVADINGDGLADLVGFGTAGVYVALATGKGTFGEMYLAKNLFGAGAEAGSWTSAGTFPRTLADINGDGLADLVGFGTAGVYAALATGNGTFGEMYLAKGAFGAGIEAGGWTSAGTYPRTLADINGDGLADLVGFGNAGVYAALATGKGGFGEMYLAAAAFGAAGDAGGWTSADKYPRMLADINGDGMADLVGFGEAGVYAALANGNGSFGRFYLAKDAFGASTEAGGWASNNTYPRLLADINGDGLDDIVGFGNVGVYVSLATGGGGFGTMIADIDGFGAAPSAGGWSSDNRYPRVLADVNGDGLDDIIGFGENGVFVTLADGFKAASTAAAFDGYAAAASAEIGMSSMPFFVQNLYTGSDTIF